MTTTLRLTRPQLQALTAIDSGCVYSSEWGYWTLGRKCERVRSDVLARVVEAGLAQVGKRDPFFRCLRVVLTDAGRRALEGEA